MTEDDALREARLRESAAGGQLVKAEENLLCRSCGKTFTLEQVRTIPCPGEEVHVDAILLPVS